MNGDNNSWVGKMPYCKGECGGELCMGEDLEAVY